MHSPVRLCAGVEGKAGMAAVAHSGSQFDLDAFLIAVQKALPSYARPVFLRLLPSVDTTGETQMQGRHTRTQWSGMNSFICSSLSSGTFKIQKTQLQREGFKPHDQGEKVYFLNSCAGRYDAVTDELYSAILEGRVYL